MKSYFADKKQKRLYKNGHPSPQRLRRGTTRFYSADKEKAVLPGRLFRTVILIACG
jgi:hypothetical protein